ncbi:MAG: hypothetical protein ABIT04_09835 [Novosphingobium sp.]
MPAPSPGDLLIERARFTGSAGRSALAEGLAHVAIGDVAAGEEMLVIPRLRASTPLSRSRPPGDFGAGLTDQLRALRAVAVVDPLGPVAGGRALRFTSKARYAAWLVGQSLEGPAGHATTLGDPASVRHWLVREIVSDGPALVATAARLQRGQLLARWIAGFADTELGLAAAALTRAYGAAIATGSPAPTDVPRRSLPGTRRRSRAKYQLGSGGHDTPATLAERIFADAWGRLARTEPEANALARLHAHLALALAVLAEQPGLGPLIERNILERARAESSAATRGRARASWSTLDPPPPVADSGAATNGASVRRGVPRRDPAWITSVEPGPQPVIPADPSPFAEQPIAERAPPAAAKPEADEPAAAPWPLRQAVVTTAYGGVFFLLNALLALRLYPDFSEPHGRRLAPSPLWLVDRLALHVFGREYRRDPLHLWLARVGVAGPLPAAWEVDPDWLSAPPSGPYGFRRTRSRTVLWDSRGFALVDAPVASPAMRRRCVRRYRCCGDLVSRLAPAPRRLMPRDADARWIACLGEFLRARLALAGEALGFESLHISARLVADETRIDLHFELARLPIAVRLAGLDRDPGWLPAEGRAVQFHFA